MKVVYIAGCGRSGSTLLGHLLGQMPGFCFIGEAMWSHPRLLSTRLCGCGTLLRDCEFWRGVRREMAGGGDPAEAQLFGLGRLARWRHLPLTFAPDHHRRLEAVYGEAWPACRRLYPAVAAVSGAGALVDSSKSVSYARMLGLMPDLDLHVVHLVRDARAVAHSWQRLKPAPDRSDRPFMEQHSPSSTALLWVSSNLGAELFCRRAPGRYQRLRYEDLVARPRAEIERIARMVGGQAAGLSWTGERALRLHPTHSVTGNPDRLATGVVELTLDAQWKRAMARRERLLVTALTWPLLLRYGYGRG